MRKRRDIQISREKKVKHIPLTIENVYTLINEEVDLMRERILDLENNSQVMTTILLDVLTCTANYKFNAIEQHEEIDSFMSNLMVSLGNLRKLAVIDSESGAESIPSINALRDFMDANVPLSEFPSDEDYYIQMDELISMPPRYGTEY